MNWVDNFMSIFGFVRVEMTEEDKLKNLFNVKSFTCKDVENCGLSYREADNWLKRQKRAKKIKFNNKLRRWEVLK